MIAFRIYKEGIYNHEYKGRRGEVLWDTRILDQNGKNIFIKRKELASYLDEYFWSAMELYCMTETLKSLPFAGGWAEQPAEIITVLALLKTENAKWEEEQSLKRQSK